jgi:hypothetical protein
MKKIILFAAILISIRSYGDGKRIPFGGVNHGDTAYAARALLADSEIISNKRIIVSDGNPSVILANSYGNIAPAILLFNPNGDTTILYANTGGSGATLYLPENSGTIATMEDVIAAVDSAVDTTVTPYIDSVVAGKVDTGTTNYIKKDGSIGFGIGGDASGDIYYRGTGNNIGRLAIGNNGEELHVTGSLPSWQFNQDQTYTSDTIDGTSATSTLLFTTEASHGRFMPARISIELMVVSGSGSKPVINIGWTNPAYNDWVSGTTLSPANQYQLGAVNPSSSSLTCPAGTGMYINVTSASTYTDYKFIVILQGLYDNQ